MSDPNFKPPLAYWISTDMIAGAEPGEVALFRATDPSTHIVGESELRALRQAIDYALCEEPRELMPDALPCDLAGKIVDEVFGGAIEDASVIEDIYRVIARHHNAQRGGA